MMAVVFAFLPLSTSYASIGEPGCRYGSDKVSGALECSSDRSPSAVTREYGLDMLLPDRVESAFDERFIIVKPIRFILGSFGVSPLERPPSR
jgi:hypothetical protein